MFLQLLQGEGFICQKPGSCANDGNDSPECPRRTLTLLNSKDMKDDIILLREHFGIPYWRQCDHQMILHSDSFCQVGGKCTSMTEHHFILDKSPLEA